MTIKNNILIIGIGNTLRSDDGIGAFICNQIEEKKLPGVVTMIVQQLDITHAEIITIFPTVIFVDASVNEAGVLFQTMLLENAQPQSFTHHINAAMVAQLSAKLFPGKTNFYICEVGGDNFEMGASLSIKAKKNTQNAVDIILQWIETNN